MCIPLTYVSGVGADDANVLRGLRCVGICHDTVERESYFALFFDKVSCEKHVAFGT